MNGTSTSKANFIEGLDKVARNVKNRYGISIRFVEIIGRRCSHIAGIHQEDRSFLPPERIKLNDRYSILSELWNDIPAQERKKLMTILQGLIAEHGQK